MCQRKNQKSAENIKFGSFVKREAEVNREHRRSFMNKIQMGRTRKKSNGNEIASVSAENRRVAADAVFVLGAAAVCVMLTLPLLPSSAEPRAVPLEETAVMVMSGAVQTSELPEREELVMPSNAEEEEWNFYDYIGELFAGLLFGQG